MQTQGVIQLDLLNKMIDEVQDYAIMLLDKNGGIITWNRGARRIYGYVSNEILGKNFGVFFTAGDREVGRVERMIDAAASVGRVKEEGWCVRKDGSVFWASIVINAIHNDDGSLGGFGTLTHDLSERRQAELEEQNARLLENKNKELEQFVYIASHDLQEPLRTINGMVKRLSSHHKEQLDEQALNMMSFIVEASNRMKELIHGLLDYSRLGRNKELVLVNFNTLVNDVIADMALTISESGTQITVGDLPVLKGYETELRLLFQNLLGNGIKFRKEGVSPQIEIAAEMQHGYWTFLLRDNGIGIDDEHKERVFMIFQRLHLRNKYEGSGLGLAHCRKIADLHGGNIWVESVLDVGSTFYFTIKT